MAAHSDIEVLLASPPDACSRLSCGRLTTRRNPCLEVRVQVGGASTRRHDVGGVVRDAPGLRCGLMIVKFPSNAAAGSGSGQRQGVAHKAQLPGEGLEARLTGLRRICQALQRLPPNATRGDRVVLPPPYLAVPRPRH